jgi:hypothetical protein
MYEKIQERTIPLSEVREYDLVFLAGDEKKPGAWQEVWKVEGNVVHLNPLEKFELPAGTNEIVVKRRQYVEWDTLKIAQDRQEEILDELSEHEDLWEDDEDIAAWVAENEEKYPGNFDTVFREKWGDLLESKAFDDACGDRDLTTRAWDDLCEALGEMLEEKSPDGLFYVTGRNMGWQHRSGYKVIETSDGAEFLQKLLPKTDCTFRIFDLGDELSIWNAHHDAPTGEGYSVYPCGKKNFCWKMEVPEGMEGELEAPEHEFIGALNMIHILSDPAQTEKNVLEEIKMQYGDKYKYTPDYSGANDFYYIEDGSTDACWIRGND